MIKAMEARDKQLHLFNKNGIITSWRKGDSINSYYPVPARGG